KVRPGVRLAEALAPAIAPVDDAGEEPVLDRVTPVHADALPQVPGARAGWPSGRGELLVEDDVEHRGQVMAPVARRPAQPEEPGGVQRRVPRGLLRPVRVVRRRGRQAWVVVGEPGTQACAELGFRGG